MPPKKKGKEGRPSKYVKKYCEALVRHMARGLSFETFGPSIGVATSSTYRWLKDEEHDDAETKQNKKDFREAKALGTDYCRLFWEEVGLEGVWLTEGGRKLNTSAWIFNMKNRFGWQDRKEVEDTNKIQTVRIELPGQQEQQVISLEPKKIGSSEDGTT